MFSYLMRLLDSHNLSPHGFCLLWKPELLWTHVISDAAIGLAYMTIPISLAVILLRRKDIPFGGVVWSFALFITACGLTHFMSIWTLWRPDYGVEALIKLITAVVSVLTALLMWRLIPLAVSLPSPADLNRINAELQQRIVERDAAIAALQKEKEDRIHAEATLLQTQKLDALGQLTSGVAHDFNNLLQGIQGAFELIKRRAVDTVKVQQLAEDGLNATRRGARLSSQLLAFSRSKQLKPEIFLIDDLISNLHDMLSRTLGSSIDLRFDLSADDVSVQSDRTQLELALLNLAINARDAIASDGRIIIRTTVLIQTHPDPDLPAGRYVKVSVEDNGAGMPPEVRDKAVDPFFTTKPLGKGTGLGLSQVYGFAKQAGGVARIDSTPGQGSTIDLILPRGADGHAPAAEPRLEAQAASRPAHVLVVDDDEAVRSIAVEMLESMGHRVTQAADGASALAAINIETPDVLLADYAMPGMTGVELAKQVLDRAPSVHILFVTGYADLDAVQTALGQHQTILRKPYRLEELERSLGEALKT